MLSKRIILHFADYLFIKYVILLLAIVKNFELKLHNKLFFITRLLK